MTAVSVLPTYEPSTDPTVPPRVRLDVTDTGSPAIFSTTVTRLNPDGTISPVRTQDGNPLGLSTFGSNRTGLLYDYEAPFGSPVTYSTVESPGTVSGAVTVGEPSIWLIHPGVPVLSRPVILRPGSLQAEIYSVGRGVFYPMGRATPVVQTDGVRRSSQSSIIVSAQSLDELADLQALLADASVLLLNIPPALGTGVDARYIAIGDVTVSRLTDVVIDGNRDITLPFVVVDRPAGGSQSARTYADLLTYPTYAALQAAYSTYAAVLSGP